MPVRLTPRGYRVIPRNPTHTATVKGGPRSGETWRCNCARTVDHFVTSEELVTGSWRDTHPVLF